MKKSARLGRVIRSLATIFLIGFGLLYANSAAFHWWASWGPPSPDPHAHERAAARHLAYAIVLVLAGAWVGFSLRMRRHDGQRHCEGRKGLDEVRALLRNAGVPIESTTYDEAAFDSWVLRIAEVPPVRVVWDGKDRWVSVETETEEVFDGQRVWKSIWTGREEHEQDPRQVAEVVIDHLVPNRAG